MAARVPPARGAAGLVVVLPSPRDDRRRARRGRRVARWAPLGRGRARSRGTVARVDVRLRPAAAPVRRGRRGIDPHPDGTSWTVGEVDNLEARITLRRSNKGRGAAPDGLVPSETFGRTFSKPRSDAWCRSLLAGDGRYPHLERVLRREAPLGGRRVQRGELAEQRAILDELERSYLVVQGPPGSGKTYRGARLVTHLLGQGRKVWDRRAEPQGDPQPARRDRGGCGVRGVRLQGDQARGDSESEHVKQGDVSDALDPEVTLVAGTAWLLAREELDGVLDTLVVDEAGQYSLADTLACGTSARRLVLLGDQLQLAQVTQGVHPGASGASVLEHLLGDHRDDAEEWGSSSSRPGGCTRRSAVHLGRVLRGAARLTAPGCADGRPPTASGSAGSRSRTRGTAWSPTRRSPRSARDRAAARARVPGRARGSDQLVTSRHDGRRAVQRAGADATRPAARGRRRSAPSTSSRGARRRSSSTRWRAPRAGRTFRAASTSCVRREPLNVAMSRAQCLAVRRVRAGAPRRRLHDRRADAARERGLPVRRAGHARQQPAPST